MIDLDPDPFVGIGDIDFGDLAGLDIGIEQATADPVPALDDARATPLGSLVWRPSIYSRGTSSWVAARSWSARTKKADLQSLKVQKILLLDEFVEAAADDLAKVLAAVYGPPQGAIVTTVPCGHSRRADCFGRLLAMAVATRIKAPFVCCFADRFLSGSSHPKEFDRLPPLVWVAKPDRPVILIDDVATSGFHMNEGLTALRQHGPAFGAVWLGGNVKAG